MAQLRKLLLLFIFNIFACGFVSSQSENINDVKLEELTQFVLNTFNYRPEKSIYTYNSAKVITAHTQNDSATDYYLHLKFSVSCHPDIVSETECFLKDLICEVVVSEDPISGSKTINDNGTKCVLPTHEEEEVPVQDEHTSDPNETKKEDENLKSVVENCSPFLLKQNIEHMIATAEETTTTSDIDERMIPAEETVVEEVIIKEPSEPQAVEDLIVKKKAHCTGCVTDISTDLPELQEFTDEALTMIDENSNGVYKHNLIKITKAQKQVVSGIKYILTLEVAETYCLKTSGQDRETCEPSLATSRTCVVEFIVKPWRFSRNIISNNCTQDNNDLVNDIVPNFENEIEPHFTNQIESQFESEVEPHLQVDSEPKPFFASKSESDRKGIFDYLDEMDKPTGDTASTGFEETIPSETFDERDEQDLDFEDIAAKEDFTVKPENVKTTIDNEKVETENSARPSTDQPKKSSDDDQDSRSQSDEEVEVRERQFKEDSSESKENSDESTENVSPKVTDADFVGGVYRKRREVRSGNRLGGLKNIGETEKKLVHDLAELAVRTLDEIDADDSKRVVLEILDAKKQLVDGVMYHLKLRVGSTSCEENKEITNGCLQDQIATPKICSIQLHRSFAADSPNDVKVVKSECTNEPRGRHRRSGRKLVGGYEAANISDPYIQEVASFALSELDKGSNSLFHQSMIRIVEARQQVVAGLNIQLTLELGDSNCRKGEDHTEPCQCQQTSGCPVTQICRVTIWDQPWLKKRVMTNSSCETKEAQRTKRSTPHIIVGGPQDISVDEPDVQEMAKFSLAHLDGMSNALYAQKIVKVLHATRQVVAGKKYDLTLELGYSSCRKGQGIDLESCNLKEDSNNQICHVEVWTRPWLKDTRVLNASCSPSVDIEKRSLIGGGTHDIHIGLFRDFVAKHEKTYPNEIEYKRRFRIFRANMKKVEALQQTEKGTAKYGATRFADLTSKEFRTFHLGLRRDLKAGEQPMLPTAKIPDVPLPPDFDWRNYNAVTPVKNQGMCGSCWAFSVTGNVEGQWALRRGELLSLSEQELVDCDKLDDGCKGGLPENAYKAITTLGGLETESDYPYDGDDEKCHFNKTEVKVTVTGGVNITTNETQMAQWLVKNGPISIGINANAMQFYMGGVSHPWKMLCNAADLDHGVLIVGYGVHKTSIRHKILPYWIIKNSWGPHWGEKGYYRVYRGDGTCGVNQMATSAVIG